MTHSEVFKILYGNNDGKIIELLNKSIYVTEQKFESDTFFIHTGFTFKMHSGKNVELIYDYFKRLLIRQPRNDETKSAPQIFGIWITKISSEYFNAMNGKIIVGIIEKTDSTNILITDVQDYYKYIGLNEINEIICQDEDGLIETYNEFRIEDRKNEESIIIPIQRKYEKLVHYDSRVFSLYSERIRIYNENKERERQTSYDDDFRAATDGQLDDYDYGEDGWTFLGRD